MDFWSKNNQMKNVYRKKRTAVSLLSRIWIWLYLPGKCIDGVERFAWIEAVRLKRYQ